MAINPTCLPRIVSVNSACGCTLTRATIEGMSPEDFEALGNSETEHLAKVVAGYTEAKIIGVQERGFSMLMKSAIMDGKPKLSFANIDGQQSIINPYIQRPQKSVVNANYWNIASGEATPGAGANGIPANAWDVLVNTGPSPWASHSLQNFERYFSPGKTVIVLNWDNTTDRNAQTVLFRIFRSVNADSGPTKRARVTLVPNVAASVWAGYNAGDKAPYEPTFGMVQTGANSVHGYEEWCFNSPAENPIKLIVDWLQWSRNSRCVDDEYRKTLDAVMSGKTNSFMKKFSGYIPLVEQNKQAAMLEEAEWMRSIWYGRKLVGQTTANFMNLDELKVYDPEDGNCLLGYKSQASGLQEKLEECGRVIDLNGGQLDLDFILEQGYYIKRHRSAEGDSVSTIDVFTDRFTRDKIKTVMLKRLKAKYDVNSTMFFKPGEKITHNGTVMFEYDIYDIEEHGYRLAVFSDDFFDDHLSSFTDGSNGTTDFRSRGRQLWFIDWSDWNPVIAGKRSIIRKNPDPATSALYKCRMDANVREYNLTETIWTVFVDRPYRHLVIHNFGDVCPKLTVYSCPVTLS